MYYLYCKLQSGNYWKVDLVCGKHFLQPSGDYGKERAECVQHIESYAFGETWIISTENTPTHFLNRVPEGEIFIFEHGKRIKNHPPIESFPPEEGGERSEVPPEEGASRPLNGFDFPTSLVDLCRPVVC